MAHYFYAIFLTGRRRNEEVISHAERALELDPFTPTTVFYVIAIYGLVRQYDRATALAKESLSLFPNDPGIHFWLSWLYHFKGMTKEAFAEYQKLIELGLPPNSINLIYISALLGEKSRARKALNDLLMQPQEMSSIDPLLCAAVYVLLGENDKAFEWLDKCYEQRNYNMFNLNVIPFFESLHGDPRFTALLKKIGLEK